MKAIVNGIILTESQQLQGRALLLEGDRIAAIADSAPQGCELVDAQGGYITPGLIDTHSDSIEHLVLPRAHCPMDFEMALRADEKILAGQGITTIYHSISLYAKDYFGEKEIRKQGNMYKFAELIHSFHQKRHLIRHRFHLRIEIDKLEAFDIVSNLLREGKVHAISFMDHTPGQGQYHSLEAYRRAIAAYDREGMTDERFQQILEEHRTKRVLSFDQLKALADLACARGLPVASHDDDTVEKLALNRALGVTVSEFPITLEVAQRAKEMGFSVTAGAPNILLGGSHSGNMSAAEGVLAGAVDSLCSDYYTVSLLQAAFLLHQRHGLALPQAFCHVTSCPAAAMKIGRDYGAIAPGKKADLLVIHQYDGYPTGTRTFVDGVQVAAANYR